jgi:hypothetical protein
VLLLAVWLVCLFVLLLPWIIRIHYKLKSFFLFTLCFFLSSLTHI